MIGDGTVNRLVRFGQHIREILRPSSSLGGVKVSPEVSTSTIDTKSTIDGMALDGYRLLDNREMSDAVEEFQKTLDDQQKKAFQPTLELMQGQYEVLEDKRKEAKAALQSYLFQNIISNREEAVSFLKKGLELQLRFNQKIIDKLSKEHPDGLPDNPKLVLHIKKLKEIPERVKANVEIMTRLPFIGKAIEESFQGALDMFQQYPIDPKMKEVLESLKEE